LPELVYVLHLVLLRSPRSLASGVFFLCNE